VKNSTLVMAFGIALAVSRPTIADILKGDRFITAMKDNTVSGRTTAGIAYNFYFVAGGAAIYSDAAGHRIAGRWHLDRMGDVCVVWKGDTPLRAGCYRVSVNARRVTWTTRSTQVDNEVRGTVINVFPTPGKPISTLSGKILGSVV
jgi:hypothetical protein